jgi:hypothetical protein
LLPIIRPAPANEDFPGSSLDAMRNLASDDRS